MKTRIPLYFSVALLTAFPVARFETQGLNPDNSQPRLEWRVAPDAGSPNAPLLLCIGMHIEPLGAQPSALAGIPGARPTAPPNMPPPRKQFGNLPPPRYQVRPFFEKHVDDIRRVTDCVERHGGRLTVQAQSPFTVVAMDSGVTLLADLEKRGHEIGLHFHEDAHLGRGSESLTTATWAAVMKKEIDLLKKAGASRVRYWSGGNLFPGVLNAAAAAGLDVMSDHKNPRSQQTDERLLAIQPWRPAGGPAADDVASFAQHDPKGKIIYLPDGIFSRVDQAGMRRAETAGGDWKYFDLVTEGLELSLRAARPDRVNVFHITVHPGEFRGRDGEPFAVIEAWLGEVLDPVVKAGKVRWATFSQMAEAYAQWEKKNPGADPRGESTKSLRTAAALPRADAAALPRGFITFVVNVHDTRHPDDSAATLKRLMDLLEKHGVRGEFYFTAPVVERHVEKHPELIARLKGSRTTISYHVRAPHPLWKGFDQPLQGKNGEDLAAVLRDYETFQLDLATGGLNREKPGGYRYVEQVFGRKPSAVGANDSPPPVKAISNRVYAELGARVGVFYHESGTRPEAPFEFRNGLLARPSDFSVTRFKMPGNPEGGFWWDLQDSPRAEQSDPVALLKRQLAD